MLKITGNGIYGHIFLYTETFPKYRTCTFMAYSLWQWFSDWIVAAPQPEHPGQPEHPEPYP